MRFAPLHIYSAYSFLQSGLTTKKIINSIQKNGYFGAAICDNGVMYGIPDFITNMEKIKAPFIVGMEVKLNEENYCLYVLNEKGYLNLSYISTSIQKGDMDHDILQSHLEGLLCILDTSCGKFKELFLNEEISEQEVARYLNEISKPFKDFYLGIEYKDRSETEYVKTLRAFAKEHTYLTVAFPHIKYQKKEDAIVLTIVEAIERNEKIEKKEESGNQYFMSLENYQKIYTEEELENTCKIVELTNFNFHQKRGEMLHFGGENANKILKDKCYETLKAKGLESNSEYIDRLEYELGIINSMGYDDYFLLVQDYVNWSRNNGILVGLRGSAAGSLVSYLLGLSSLDPIYYHLQFERFLNPSRRTMPDIDIDFMDSRRGEVIDYCRSKYGNEKVANIITYSRILSKQAIRDIGMIYNFNSRHIGLLCDSLGDKSLDLRDSYRKNTAFKNLVDSDKYYLEIVSLASKIEGLIRQSGLHAAGVILNNDPIIESLPLTSWGSDTYVSQYEMGYLEEQGFLKMDFLGLNNLTIVSNCVDLINQRHSELKLDKFNLPFDDKKVYELISSLQTMGIFQLESSGMKKAIKTLKPSSYDDVAALLALFRPGPEAEIVTYARRKAGLEPVPKMSEGQQKILGSTYGIIVYQEQITELAVTMAGMKIVDADNFRRAISKKKVELLSSLENDFINGSIKNGYSKEEAKDYYDRIAKFASYGFNKSHAYGYALLSCQMAYLKAYYPLEFYTVILGSPKDENYLDYLGELRRRGYSIVNPSINKSTTSYSIDGDNILFPLNNIKSINVQVASKIIEERNKGLFTDFFDFVSRTYGYKITRDQILNLIDAGAFDEFKESRSTLRNSIDVAMQYADLVYSPDGNSSLSFSMAKPMPIVTQDNPIDNLDREYEAIGTMLSDNPLRYKKEIYEQNHALTIRQVLDLMEDNKARNKVISTIGIIRKKKTITTKAKEQMAFVGIFDETSQLEVVFFPKTYKEYGQYTKKNMIVLLEGYIDNNRNENNFIINKVTLLEDVDNG